MIVPKRNEKQVLEDIPEEIRKAMKFEYVEKIDTVIKLALDKKKPALPIRNNK